MTTARPPTSLLRFDGAVSREPAIEAWWAARPPELSGGERQRIAIARALANGPGVILADEATGRLDSATSGKVLDLRESLRRNQGATVVVVTHDPAVAARADRVIRMLDGRVVEDGSNPRPAVPAAPDARP